MNTEQETAAIARHTRDRARARRTNSLDSSAMHEPPLRRPRRRSVFLQVYLTARRSHHALTVVVMHSHQDTRSEAAIYWSAISLIVCEGLSIRAAAERLGIESGQLRNILRNRRQQLAARLNVTDSRHSPDP